MELNAHSSIVPILGDRIIKVDHAGEHGAFCIYSGQIFMAHLTAHRSIVELREFRSHEARHRAIFEAELQRRNRPRCRSYWFCGVGGYLLGLITGSLGASAIAATTFAIEQVVVRHLHHQMKVLRNEDPQAVSAISQIIDDEQRHLDSSVAVTQSNRLCIKALTPIVSASTEAVIWLGMKL